MRYNPVTKEFVVYAETKQDQRVCRLSGMDRSFKSTGPNGELVWYSKSPYAALQFYAVGDDQCKEILNPLWDDYQASWAEDCEEDFPLPPGEEFLPFQKAGVKYALSQRNVLIGDDMGLGKTIQAIGIANATAAKKVLVVCPANVRTQWEKQILRFSTMRRPIIQKVMKGSDGISPDVNYIVISYNLASSDALLRALCRINWDILILDEAHYLKTPEAKRTRAVFGGGSGIAKNTFLAKFTKRIVGLTGTPLVNRPRECYILARACDWESIEWASFDTFTNKFNPIIQTESGGTFQTANNLPELQARLRCNFMVRRLKSDVLKDLPDLRPEVTYIESNGDIQRVLKEEAMLDFDPTALNTGKLDLTNQAIATVRREMGMAMAPRVVEHLHYLVGVQEVEKVIIAAYHHEVMDYLQEQLAPYGAMSYRGGMSDKAKEKAKTAFIGTDARFLIGQIISMAEGVDGLQDVCSTVVIAEPDWTPGKNEQFIGRCHRIGQHNNVLAQFLVAEGSIAEKIVKGVILKLQVNHRALDKRFVTHHDHDQVFKLE